MIEQREELTQRPADHRQKAEWIDVTNSVRDGARQVCAPHYAGDQLCSR
jgi:hypothetical protein